MRIVALLSFIFSSFIQTTAHGYTLTNASSGQAIRWRYGQKLYLAGNPTGTGIHSSFFYDVITYGLQQWKWASEGQFDFDYWQGTNASTYKAALSHDGLSSIFFASNSNSPSDPNVIGFTQVWYNDRTGDILESDVMLNDRHYHFTEDPTDTSARTVYWGSQPTVYLGNVVTHELGHAIGLSHSADVNSSMLYVEFSEQAKLGCDDWAATRHLYHSAGGTGSLSGVVISPYGDPVSGAVVSAISQTRGIPIASVNTDQSGNYHFGALEPGSYSIMVQPYQGSVASVPARFQAKVSNWCGNGSFPSQFVTESDSHTLVQYTVGARATTSAGTFRIGCSAVPNSQSLFSTQMAPDTLVDSGSAGSSKTYLFQVNGPFTITGLGHLLLSPVKVRLAVTHANGSPVATTNQSPLYQSTSQYRIPDSQVSGTAYGTIRVRVTVENGSMSDFPAPAIYPNADPIYVLNLNSHGSPPSSALPENARCAPPESFAKYQSPPGDPIRFSTTKSARDNIGFCGTANADPTNHSKRTSASTGSILGWLFPFFVAIAAQLSFRKRHVKLKS